MIAKSLKLIKEELNVFLKTILPNTSPADPNDIAVLGNVSQIEGGTEADKIKNSLVISLVNIEEEKRLKNGKTFQVNGNETIYQNPPINVNLYVLFSANYDDYGQGLGLLSNVIAFFQGKKFFDANNSPTLDDDSIEFHMEIHTLNFEQINDLWGSLGGKQVPFVMYKMRLLCISRELLRLSAPVIEEIEGEDGVI